MLTALGTMACIQKPSSCLAALSGNDCAVSVFALRHETDSAGFWSSVMVNDLQQNRMSFSDN